jgi:hypothetical protein
MMQLVPIFAGYRDNHHVPKFTRLRTVPEYENEYPIAKAKRPTGHTIVDMTADAPLVRHARTYQKVLVNWVKLARILR